MRKNNNNIFNKKVIVLIMQNEKILTLFVQKFKIISINFECTKILINLYLQVNHNEDFPVEILDRNEQFKNLSECRKKNIYI